MDFQNFYEVIDSLENTLDKPYAITGSSAVYVYLYIINTSESKKFLKEIGRPLDIDVLVKSKSYINLDYKFIGDYKRINQVQDRSSRYENSLGKYLDLTFVPSLSIKTLMLNGKTINLHNPKSILEDYDDYLDTFDDLKKRKALIKIEALKYISMFEFDMAAPYRAEGLTTLKKQRTDTFVPLTPSQFRYNSPTR